MSLGAALFLLFLALKLTHETDWSWWAVLAPLFPEALIDLVIVTVILAAVRARKRGVKDARNLYSSRS